MASADLVQSVALCVDVYTSHDMRAVRLGQSQIQSRRQCRLQRSSTVAVVRKGRHCPVDHNRRERPLTNRDGILPLRRVWAPPGVAITTRSPLASDLATELQRPGFSSEGGGGAAPKRQRKGGGKKR